MLAALPTGCTYSGGELLFLLGFGKRKTEAKFQLTQEPLLILFDDPGQRVDHPLLHTYVFDELSQQLLRNKAAAKIIPRTTIERLRQSVPNFEDRGCRELGEIAGAKQVLWLEAREFFASEDFVEASAAAYLSVAVRVINVEESQRTRVRVYPESPGGHILTVALDGATVMRLKKKDDIAKELAALLADKTAKLFYAHELGDFEPEE